MVGPLDGASELIIIQPLVTFLRQPIWSLKVGSDQPNRPHVIM